MSSKRIAIMQPYLFPYLGYYQLMNAVDLFVYHDDVQYIKGGWINRNRYLTNGNPGMFTFPVVKDKHEKNINERFFFELEKSKKAFIKLLKNHYRNAPYYDEVYKLVNIIFDSGSTKVSELIYHTNKIISDYLQINVPVLTSSEIEKNNMLRGEDRVIEICKKTCGSSYINLSGGMELYSKEKFLTEGLELFFIKAKDIQYKQFENDFVGNLSIIDVMMFNSKEQVKSLLEEYTLR